MLFYVILAILATGLGLLVFNHDAGGLFGLPLETVGSITLLSSLILYLMAGRLGGRADPVTSVKQIAIWVLIGFGLVLGYSFKDDGKMLLSRVAGELVPGQAIEQADGGVSFRRAVGGHFEVVASVGQQDVRMLVDTGASSVVLSYEDALAVGFGKDDLRFSATVSTANGTTKAARIVLPRLSVGGIEARNVRAMVSQPGDLDQSLLGMSYLSKLSGWTVRGDRLTLLP